MLDQNFIVARLLLIDFNDPIYLFDFLQNNVISLSIF